MSTSAKLLLIGAGGHARSCIDVILNEGRHEIAGLIATQAEIGKKILGHEVISDETGLSDLRKKIPNALIAVGQIKTPQNRIRLFELLSELDFKLPVICSPLAHVSGHATIRKGSIIMHHTLLNAGVIVGQNCIINSKALLEHDTEIGDHCHISTGAIINGGTKIGSQTFVGSGSVIREGLTIGQNCTIPMGAHVRHDLPAGTLFKQVETK